MYNIIILHERIVLANMIKHMKMTYLKILLKWTTEVIRAMRSYRIQLITLYTIKLVNHSKSDIGIVPENLQTR